MAGSSNITGDESIFFCDNMSFDGTERGGKLTTNGQLWIGSTPSRHVRAGFITSNDGSVTITNGPGTIDLSASSPPFNPAKIIQDFDDFVSGTGHFNWGGSSTTAFDSTATNPGILQIVAQAFPIFSAIYIGQASLTTNPFKLGGGSLNINFVFDLVTLGTALDDYTLYIGLADIQSIAFGTAPNDGCYFQYNRSVNGGNWQIVTTNSGVSTTGNTTTAASAGFHNYGIQINAAGTSVSFFIDGVQVVNSPLAANIPVATINPSIMAVPSIGSTPDMLIDLFYYTQTLTVSR